MPPAARRPQGLAGMRVRISSKVCTMCTPSRLPAPPAHFTQRRSSRRAGADHQARWRGARGGQSSELEVLERRWRGLGVHDAYGRRGEREARCCSWGEGNGDMGRRWRVWRSSGERGRRWLGLGVGDAYRWRREREARCCSWGEGDADMGSRWRVWRRSGERGRRWRGLGVGDAYRRHGEREARCCSWGEGDVDMGWRRRACRRSGEPERRERGLGGSWRRLRVRERRESAGGVWWRCGEREGRGRVRRAGGGRERRLLRDWASSRGESGQSGGVGGAWGASRGGAWYLGGGGSPPPSVDLPRRGVAAVAAGGTG